MKSYCTVVACLAAASIGSLAHAGTVVIENVGGGLTLHSGDLSATVFGGVQPGWSNASLASVHAALGASGITTDGKVTTLLADTDHGLALLVLIDNETGGSQTPNSASLSMTSFGHGANLAYVNDINETVLITPQSATSRLATGSFAWDSTVNGDGFGWANLVVGNTLTFQFTRPVGQPLGLDDPGTFQFVSWNGTQWEVVNNPLLDGSFTEAGQFGFATVVIPLPGTALLAGVPLATLAFRRRRRM